MDECNCWTCQPHVPATDLAKVKQERDDAQVRAQKANEEVTRLNYELERVRRSAWYTTPPPTSAYAKLRTELEVKSSAIKAQAGTITLLHAKLDEATRRENDAWQAGYDRARQDLGLGG